MIVEGMDGDNVTAFLQMGFRFTDSLTAEYVLLPSF